ncbi:glycosyl transferase group 1 [Rhodomicrobium vannielii ATCC 17100]|uniref:Glycosyl transferase group 1 n=1 Tax=Rhodomicrobium vannielii (strain ATCC 17100 / DSM 162 / LMG 4299 / NCIMB 10020 / ATH 3.1.1) TaxID=648757 RepID=E3I868_RHOVT|nr:glycosyltransferase family 4 protein [Rhodomicrobium vannielii]ADP69693.1 glycosyl transferase group 1 [Rhodomicrobium vannielii ATCC 17100]
MSRIRVLHTLCRIHSGGVEQRRILLAQALGQDRYEHAVICQEADGPIPGVLRDAGWTIHEIGLAHSILDPAWHARAHAIARAFQPDIAHGAVYEGEALACSIGLRIPRVKVVMEETSDPVDRRWTGNALMRAMCMRADACIGVSPKVTGYLRETLRIPQRKIHLINNAVPSVPPPSLARMAEMRARLGISEGDVIIGSVGRVDGNKRFSDIIRALPMIRSSQPRARLLIVGDGPDRVMLERLTEELDVTGAVIFAGYQGAPRDYYHLMDVFVLASAHEAFGLVLVEAMLSGVPVVATEVGGIPFVLAEGKAGVLVPAKQHAELANAVIRLLADQSSAQAFSSAGLERALSAFAPERYVAEVAQLYADLVRQERA